MALKRPGKTNVWLALLVFVLQALLPPTVTLIAAQGSQDVFRQADALIKEGAYGKAVELLQSTIKQGAELERAYLLLIKAAILYANDFRFRSADPATATLWLDFARDRVRDCLATRELRHTRPGPDIDPPEGMPELFQEVRNQMFGSLRVVNLEPEDAIVLLDGDTLAVGEPGVARAEEDISLGTHVVVIQAEGFQTRTDNLSFTAGSTVERDYTLKKNRGPIWYAARGGIAAALVVGGVLGLSGGKNKPLEPLPGPPDPPTKPNRR